jgi:hypothetical protein
VEGNRIEDRLCDFIKNFSDDLCSLELLLFFGRHPKARFNRTAVLHALNTGRIDCGISLKRLIERKLVITCIENGISLYCLTKEEPVHTLVVDLTKIDQRQWQSVLEQILNDQGIETENTRF